MSSTADEYILPGLLIFLNALYDVVINLFFASESDLVIGVSDGLQASIAIVTLFFLKHQVNLAFIHADKNSKILERQLGGQSDQSQTIEKLNTYRNKAIGHKKSLMGILIFLLMVTVADALIGNVDILKESKSAQIVRKVAFPACWLLEFLAVWSLFRINKWNACIFQKTTSQASVEIPPQGNLPRQPNPQEGEGMTQQTEQNEDVTGITSQPNLPRGGAGPSPLRKDHLSAFFTPRSNPATLEENRQTIANPEGEETSPLLAPASSTGDN